MPTTDLTLETITPLFLRGADNETPELREPPFKSLFRYWWRAVTAHDNPKDPEGDLFGKTDHQSKLKIGITGRRNLNSERKPPLPHRPNFTAHAFDKNQRFAIKLTFKDTLFTDLENDYRNEAEHPRNRERREYYLQLANYYQNLATYTTPNDFYENVAKIAFLLGGVGNRSRRGFGSIGDTSWNFADVDAIRNTILNALNAITPSRFRNVRGVIQSNVTRNYPVIKEIFFGELTNDVDALLKKIGNATHKHADRAIGSHSPRYASPIHVRIQKVSGQFIPICTLLSSTLNVTRQKNFINDIIN